MRFLAALATLMAIALGTAVPAFQEQASHADTQEVCGWYCYYGIITPCPDMNANKDCFNTYDVVNKVHIDNKKCGLCIWFDDENCQGAITWSGGPMEPDHVEYIPHSKSFYCLYGK